MSERELHSIEGFYQRRKNHSEKTCPCNFRNCRGLNNYQYSGSMSQITIQLQQGSCLDPHV